MTSQQVGGIHILTLKMFHLLVLLSLDVVVSFTIQNPLQLLPNEHLMNGMNRQRQRHHATFLNYKITNSSEVAARQSLIDYRQLLDPSRNNGDGTITAVKDVVMKFGGSSLATYDRIDHVAKLIKEQIEIGCRPRAIVCSAMGKTTNALLSAGDLALAGQVDLKAVRDLHLNTVKYFNMSINTLREVTELLDECEQMLKGVSLIQELSPKALDQLVSYGERCSVRIMAARLNQIGIPALGLDAWDAGICTTSDFGDAKILPECNDQIKMKFNKIDKNIVAVVTGFIGHDKNKKITTLGRSGSDLSATQLGSALNVDEIVFWKDVDGILSTDPRLVPCAIPVHEVTFEEASELAYFGAQVLHPIAMQPAQKHNIPCRVKNSYNPLAEGTIIRNDKIQHRLVSAITFKRDIKLMDFHAKNKFISYGFLGQVFTAFDKHKVSVDVLASSEVSISLTLDQKQQNTQIQSIVDDLKDVADITVRDHKAILTLIADVSRSSEVLASVFQVFAETNINVEMMSQGSSKVNISFIIDGVDLDRAVQNLHHCFFEDENYFNINVVELNNKIPTNERINNLELVALS